MKNAVLLTGISAATLILTSTGFAQYSAAEATTTISAAETVNSSQKAPTRDPRFTSRYGKSQQPAAVKPAPPATGRATQLTKPVATPQQPQPTARDPRFNSRYGGARANSAAQTQARPATPQQGAQQPPVAAVPVTIIKPTVDPEREQRIVNFQRQKAISGNPTSQYDLGMRYLKGDGVEQDRKQALSWLKMADEGGNTRAKKQLESLAKEPTPEKDVDQPADKSK